MRQCIKLGLIFLPLSVAVLIFFQNCAEQSTDSDKLSSQAFKAAPFAFDATIDTLSYMSCSEMNTSYDPRAFYSFKAGAYTAAAGIMLNSSFSSYMRYYTQSDRLKALQSSDANRGAWLQMSLRQKSNYQNILPSTGSAEPDKDYYSFLQNLDSNEISNLLLSLSTGTRASYFSSISDTSSRFMEGATRYLGSESIANSVRQQLTSNQAILALTYTGSTTMEDTAARVPAGSSGNKAYGLGYMLTFNNDVGISSRTTRVLDTVREMDLTTGATTGGSLRSWTCAQSLRMMIVRAEDVQAAITAGTSPPCNVYTSDNPTTYADQQIYTVLRRVLPVDYWSIDLANRCIVPKTTISSFSCYGTRASGAPAIAYRVATCDATNCPHYVSVCTRQ